MGMCAPVISLLGLPVLGCTAQPPFSWLHVLITGEDSGGCSLKYVSVPGLSLRWRDCSSSGLGPQVPPGSPPGSPSVGSCTQGSVGGCWLALTALSWPCPLILSYLHRVHGHVCLGPWVTVGQDSVPPGPQCYGIGAVGWVCLTRGGRGTEN